MNELALAWRLARRELRSGMRGFAVFLACLALGVAAIAAVGVTNAGVIDAIKRDAAALLGGDIRLEATNLPIAEDVLAGLMPSEARRSDAVRTNAMAFGPEGRRVVVSLKAVDGAYPLYGALSLEPPLDLAQALADGGAVVEPGVLTRLGVGIGEQIRIGEATFTVRATIVREPDQLGGFEAIGPRVMIAMAIWRVPRSSCRERSPATTIASRCPPARTPRPWLPSFGAAIRMRTGGRAAHATCSRR